MSVGSFRIRLFGLAALACALASAGAAGCRKPAFGRLTVAEVAARRAEARVYLFDNNGHARFVRSHLPGAKWLDPDHMAASDLPADKTATLIFYCHNEH